jgi:hypothetical protein
MAIRLGRIAAAPQAGNTGDMDALRLIYRREDEWYGELSAIVESGDFRGRGSAWFALEALRTFWRLAGAYPLSESEEPHLAGGYYDDGGETLKACHVGVRLSPHGPLGSILVTVTLASDDDAALHQSVTARFKVSYGDLDRFRAAFAEMLEGRSEEAVLEATPN